MLKRIIFGEFRLHKFFRTTLELHAIEIVEFLFIGNVLALRLNKNDVIN